MNQRRMMKGTVGIAGRSLALVFVFLINLSVLITLPGQGVAQKKARPGASPSPQPQVQPAVTPNLLSETAIPLQEIEPRSERLIEQLQEMDERLIIDPTIRSIDREL